MTKMDSYPLPRIDDTLDTRSDAGMFSTFDLRSGYWQVEIDFEDRQKTAFTIRIGSWHFEVKFFCICNAPATFNRFMENILRGLSWKICLVFLDDLVVMREIMKDHMKN